ncbi:MAG TPA: RNA-binding cell elongation regulator Jag/EloR [Acidimicrobiales bacterium]|nr:RNA-binding cell elongation regulator Jag/EloR [Acidimicrobiales bacterium]
MQWVETTGRTVEEALDAALDRLGVGEDDAEWLVLEEPRPGLFGRLRGEARLRVRVRPTTPRPKVDRRDRRRRSGARDDKASADGSENGSTASEAEAAATGNGQKREKRAPIPKRPSREDRPREERPVNDPAQLAREREIATEFVDGLVAAFGLDGEVSTEMDDDEIEVAVAGDDLGLLIGPRGQTLAAVQELTRTVVHRAMPERSGWLRVDVSGYRQRRKEALERFTVQVAQEVVSSGERRVLEPMGAADRKIVHDAAQQVDGVTTLSEGEEPHRRVVIAPAAAD